MYKPFFVFMFDHFLVEVAQYTWFVMAESSEQAEASVRLHPLFKIYPFVFLETDEAVNKRLKDNTMLDRNLVGITTISPEQYYRFYEMATQMITTDGKEWSICRPLKPGW